MSRLHNINFMGDGQDFPWNSSAWTASAPRAAEKQAVPTSSSKVSEVSGENGKGLLALKGNLVPRLKVCNYKMGSKHVE